MIIVLYTWSIGNLGRLILIQMGAPFAQLTFLGRQSCQFVGRNLMLLYCDHAYPRTTFAVFKPEFTFSCNYCIYSLEQRGIV